MEDDTILEIEEEEYCLDSVIVNDDGSLKVIFHADPFMGFVNIPRDLLKLIIEKL